MRYLACGLLLLTPGLAAAHKPYFSDGGHGTAADAWEIEDIDTSIVLYDEVTCEAPVLWMRFEAEADAELYVQLGVPELDWLADYRPSIAVLAPGLPEAALPFEIPEGLGAVVIDTAAVSAPDSFYEPFSQTSSWVLAEETLTLAEAGAGYVVAWDPEALTGKLWVAVGTEEVFTSEDWQNVGEWMDGVHAFHETEGSPEGAATETCEAEGEDAGPSSRGCASAPTAASGILALLAMLSARRGRNSRKNVL